MKDITPKENITNTIDYSSNSLWKLTHVLYALLACAPIFLITPIIALMIAYIKREDAQGTVFAGHFTWIIRTFWLIFIAFAVTFPFIFIMKLLIILAPIGFLLFGMVSLWYGYRILKGWWRLFEKKEISEPLDWI